MVQSQPQPRKVGDTAGPLRVQLQKNGQALPLVGATVRIRMRAATSQTRKINDALCSIDDAASGWVSYQWQPADVDTAGTFLVEFNVLFADGTDITVPDVDALKMTITPRL